MSQTVQIIDTHTHIDCGAFESDRLAVIERAKKAGVQHMLVVGVDLSSSRQIIQLVQSHANLSAVCGIHPSEVDGVTDADFESLEVLLKEKEKHHIVAVGEMGLDYYWRQDNKEKQKEVFWRQLYLAKQYDLPVVIHDREAHQDCLNLLLEFERQYGLRKPNVGVFHCYSGSLELSRELAALGFYFGFDGPITYKNAKKNVTVVAGMPLERILLETDCPYLTPVPHRGKRNEPSYLPYVAHAIAHIKGLTVEQVALKTTQNAMDLFAL